MAGPRAQIARGLRLTTIAAAALLAACSSDRILKVENPDIITPGALNNTNGAAAQYSGVLGDMSNIQDSNLGVNSSVGLFTDELKFGATPPEVRQIDQRAIPESNTLIGALFKSMQRVRGSAESAAEVLKSISTTDKRVGEVLAISGFMHVELAEMFCSGVPIGAAGVNAQPLTTSALLQAAVTKLTDAAANAGGDATVKNLADVLRARALLDLGQFDQAAAAVAGVPSSFVYTTGHGTATDYQKNTFYDYMYNFDGLLVSNKEGINGLNFATAGDPRVPVEGDGSPSRFDTQTPRYYFMKYNAYTSTSVVASGAEARLIEAEAALRGGNVGLFISKLNEARAASGMTAQVTDPGGATERVDLLFRERAFTLFGTGHRLGDLRRLVRQYGRAAESVYPTGAYHKDGLQLGTDIQIVIPQTEKNNPNFTGCLDRNA
jgi:hypothetical protein